MFSFSMADTPDELISRIRALSPAEKASLIAAVRENKSGVWGSQISSTYSYILFLLGDPIERKREVAEFRDSPFRSSILAKLGEPWVIEEVAPDLFREEEIPPHVGELPNLPLSYGAAALIIANLQEATIYPEAVLQWAKKTNRFQQPELRAVMREWWRENEQFFKDKNYQAVKPGRALELPQPIRPLPQNINPAVQPGTPLPPPAQSSPLTPSSSQQYANSADRWRLITVIAALLAFFGGGLWWFQQKKK